jgi:ABC-type transporter Mla subunit MlaD
MAERTADSGAQRAHGWPTLNIQRLFGLALVFKVVLAALGYVFDSPLWLGFVAPLVVMVAYMVVGYKTRGHEISEEKFADSCYYLGFIFTIASIVVCLLDVPNMLGSNGLHGIALRFGAAMVSTVLGMAVRVYLVSFRKDSSDAFQDAEQALLDTTRMFTAQLQDNLKTLQSFEQQVIDASKTSVANVQLQVEALSRNFSETLSEFYKQINEENRAAFREMADEGKAASARLAAAVDDYSQGMKGHLNSIESKVTQFADAVTTRLATTEFPDDYFAKRLKGPMDALALETQNVGNTVRAVNDEVKESAVALRGTINSLNAKLKSSVAVMDGVVKMTERHEALLAASEKQTQTYSGLLGRFADIENTLKAVVATAGATNQASGEVLNTLAGLAADSAGLRDTVRSSLADVAAQSAALGEAVRNSVFEVAKKIEDQTTLATAGLAKVDEHARRTEAGAASVVQAFKDHSEQLSAAGERLDVVTNTSQGLQRQLEAVAAGNADLLEVTAKRLQHVERVAAQSEQIVASLTELRPLLGRHIDALLSNAAASPNRPDPTLPSSGLPPLAAQGGPIVDPGPSVQASSLPPPQSSTNK